MASFGVMEVLCVLGFLVLLVCTAAIVVTAVLMSNRGRRTPARSPWPRCPACGGSLPDDSPEGLCPRCLLAEGLSGRIGKARASSGLEPLSAVGVPSQSTTPYRGPSTAPLPTDLANHFPQLEIIQLLGQGGMGAVYKARQPGLDRLVAVKILPAEFGSDPAFAERFTREARALAKLNHANIVNIHDFGQAGGFYYFIMEYVDGANLRQVLQGGHLAPTEALKIVPQICDALQYAHEEGVVHRDIKPENILLDKRGRVKIADFGLAKLLGIGPSGVALTASHQVMGTLHYMAPEQIERPLSVDHRADIYSLGVVFYELLTGELPLGRFALPSQKAVVDRRLDDVVLKTLEKEPDLRYQRASDLKLDLDSLGPRTPLPQTPLPRPQVSLPVDLKAARDAIWTPASGIVLAGIINFVPPLLFLFCMVLMPILFHTSGPPAISRGRSPAVSAATLLPRGVVVQAEAAPTAGSWSEPRWGTVLGGLCAGLVHVPLGILLLLGGLQMRKLRTYPFAIVACIVAMLPLSIGFVIGLPCGIWAFIVLLRPEIRAAFHATK